MNPIRSVPAAISREYFSMHVFAHALSSVFLPARSLLGPLLAIALAACGGSGSSGFDGEPSGEPEAISRALDQTSCVEFDLTTYCASSADFPVEGDVGTIVIDDPMTPLACAEIPQGEQCVASIGFQPDGFPAGTAFRVASATSIEGPWTLSGDAPPPSPGGSDTRDVEVQVPSPGASAPPSPLVVAVLVYLTSVPNELPTEALSLSNFSADVVYVSELEIAVE